MGQRRFPCTHCGKAYSHVSQGVSLQTLVTRNILSVSTFRKAVYCLPLLEIYKDHEHSKGSEKSCCLVTCLALVNPVLPKHV